MKGVVVETYGKKAALLLQNGTIIKISNTDLCVGDTLNYSPIKKAVKHIILCAASALVLVFGVGTIAFVIPYSYIGLDVNPSIEFYTNCFDIVIDVTDANDDGNVILNQIGIENLKYKSIDNAIKQAVDTIYLNDFCSAVDTDDILVTASCANKNKANVLANGIGQNLKLHLKERRIDITSQTINKSRVSEAHKNGISPGKLNLIEKLIAASGGSAADIDYWLNKPVCEIMRALNGECADMCGNPKICSGAPGTCQASNLCPANNNGFSGPRRRGQGAAKRNGR